MDLYKIGKQGVCSEKALQKRPFTDKVSARYLVIVDVRCSLAKPFNVLHFDIRQSHYENSSNGTLCIKNFLKVNELPLPLLFKRLIFYITKN